MTSSMLLEEKNQNWPVSPVSGTAVAFPLVPCAGTRQETSTLKRLSLRHSSLALGLQPASVDESGLRSRVEGLRSGAASEVVSSTLDACSSSGARSPFPPAKAAVSATLARLPDGLV